jgi:hypothetical protein
MQAEADVNRSPVPAGGRRAFVAALAAAAGVALVAAACTLNPQPLPPDNPDGSIGQMDAGSRFGGEDAGAVPAPEGADASTDNVSGNGSPDGGEEGGTTADASTDASEDASDAADQ